MTPIEIGHTGMLPVTLDVERLIESRMLVQANSGGGKSWFLRMLLERTHGRAQQIVLDVEGEFATLREHYPYVLAAHTGGDTLADVRTAGVLARRLLELGVSAIVDLYELKANERIRFVRLFLEALVAAPKDLWHPTLVVIDEAHLFCPQRGEAESAAAVIDLMTRGRKRGFCGVLATQRLSKLHKDAAAEANVKIVGRAALDVDLARASEELGLRSREDQHALRSLKAGEFFGFGPGLSDVVVRFKSGAVRTTHPKVGHRGSAVPTPTPDTVKAVLGKLADLPKEAEAEARTVDELRARVRELERAARGRPVDAGEVDRLRADLVTAKGELRDTGIVAARWRSIAERLARSIASTATEAQAAFDAAAALPSSIATARPPATVRAAAAPVLERPIRRASRERPETRDGLCGPEQRILNALAWLEATNGATQQQQTAVAFLAGYTVGGGAFNNPRGRLNTRGLIVARGDVMELTDAGRELAEVPTAALTSEEIHAHVLERLPGPEQRILRVLLDRYPDEVTNEALARAAGYEPNGGAFNNPRGRLNALGLIHYARGIARASPALFLTDCHPLRASSYRQAGPPPVGSNQATGVDTRRHKGAESR